MNGHAFARGRKVLGTKVACTCKLQIFSCPNSSSMRISFLAATPAETSRDLIRQEDLIRQFMHRKTRLVYAQEDQTVQT